MLVTRSRFVLMWEWRGKHVFLLLNSSRSPPLLLFHHPIIIIIIINCLLSPLCMVFTNIYLKQTMFLGYIALQLHCSSIVWFWNGSSRPYNCWYHFCFHNPHVLNFCFIIYFSSCSYIPVVWLLIIVSDLCILPILYSTLSALLASKFSHQYTFVFVCLW